MATLLPVRDRQGRWSGDLPPAVAQEIARRLHEGESYATISQAVGLRPATGRRKCAEVASALGLAAEESPQAAFTREVCALVEHGLTDQAIAERLGRTLDSVVAARVRGLGRKYRVTRLTTEEHAEIDRRIINRESTRSIAAAIGCNQGTVWRRSAALRGHVRTDLPPCACGKPEGHGGRCDLVVDPAYIRRRLLEGATATDIAREFNRTAQSFKPKYVDPVIADLTAEGHRCACGQPFGHRFACQETMRSQRRSFSEDQRKRAMKLVQAGKSVLSVSKDLGVAISRGQALVVMLRTEMAAAGVHCPCGLLIDHTRSCVARNGDRRACFRFQSASARSMSGPTRQKIARLARAGVGSRAIQTATGQSEWKVSQLQAELRNAGLLPQSCGTCGLPYNHKAPCPKSKRCDCGRWRHHRGPCRQPGPKLTVTNGGKPPSVERELYQDAMNRYRAGESIQRISDMTTIPWTTVQRLVAYWRAKSHFELTPCECGRPARHSGGCIKNTPAAVGKLEQARIVEALRAGEMPHRVAARFGLHVQTVLKHSASARQVMFAEGVACACGRPVGHNYWCSAKWDAHCQPRGRRPFPTPHEANAIEALLRGDPVADIAAAAGVSNGSIYRLRRTFSDEQRARRAGAVRQRHARAGRSGGRDIMAQIKAAVPRGIDVMVRDDIEAELYLAVIEGRLEVDQIKAAVRSFVSRGLSEWQSAFGPRSLDAPIFSDGRRTIADTVADTTTVDFLGA